jgi:hypothetical protein
MDAAYLLGPDGFLQGLIRLNYSLINYIKTILPFVMKGYREIVAVVVFEFAKGGVPKRKACLKGNIFGLQNRNYLLQSLTALVPLQTHNFDTL